ncbi:metallophosphoesterase [Microbacterium sp.]|uniref:metallophosphoesterase n=1 Tax=Microbacterium sp. TaxID=51671 RepID=UPI003567D132
MEALEYASSIALPDNRVAVCGDWHGNVGWARMLSRALPALAPDVTTMLHLGDWWMPPAEIDQIFAETAITRIYVTNGNHEPWNEITPLLDRHPGSAVRVSNIVWLLPRPARLSIGGRRVLSLGGAVSVDRQSRIEGRTWWPDEAITDEHVAEAIDGGPADLMLTHESPAGTPVRPVREVLRTNPHRFPKAALVESAASRVRVSEVWDAVRPELLVHGHLHAPGGGKTDDGRRIASLGRDAQEGNLGFLDMRTLKMATPNLRIIRGLADRWEDDYLERERREKSVAQTMDSWAVDGLSPSPGALRDARDYIDGRRSLDELIEDVRRRHTRQPEAQSQDDSEGTP